MQSSSRLFPVSLLRAELVGDFSEDVYLLKPNNSPDPSVQIALTRVGLKPDLDALGKNASRQPIVLLHGHYQNRNLWLSDKEDDYCNYLVSQGFDVWIPEMRGHGNSPRNQNYSSNTLEHYIRYDLPAISDFIWEMCGRPIHWQGFDAGGHAILAAIAGGWLSPQLVKSVGLWGVQVTKRRWRMLFPFLRWYYSLKVKRAGFSSGLKLQRGPEDEPSSVVIESMQRQKLFRAWMGNNQVNYWKKLESLNLPIMAIAAHSDRINSVHHCRRLFEHIGSSNKEWLSIDKGQTYMKDGRLHRVLDSHEAKNTVWNKVCEWLKAIT